VKNVPKAVSGFMADLCSASLQGLSMRVVLLASRLLVDSLRQLI
jgi:hypothetical protein